MKALSVQQPWADAILLGAKRVENRTWKTSYRGDLLIHAGKRYDDDGMKFVIDRYFEMKIAGMRPLLSSAPRRRGALLGIVTLDDCIPLADCPTAQQPWAFGPWCWMFSNPRHLADPVAWRGMQGLFNVPDDAINALSLWIERVA